MTLSEIANYRLANHQLTGTKFTTPGELVSYMGAIQAQDYAMAKWAIGIRISTTENKIEEALNNGDILRTHVLRPTWHFVAANDIHWMLKLTGPHIKAQSASMCRKLELDNKLLNRCNSIIEKALTGNKYLTREEIIFELNKKGIATNELRSVLIMMNAELDGIVCNGYRRDKQFTYALLDKKRAKSYTKEEALVALAKRYFISHGPAILQDFA